MDEYRLQQELEAMAGNAFQVGEDTRANPEPIGTAMERWQKLFGLDQSEAVERIMHHRNNLTRTRISDAHWDEVRSHAEVAGYDREAYEYELELLRKKAHLPGLYPSSADEDESDCSSITYLLELAGPLEDVEKVRRAAGMDMLPVVVEGNSTEDQRAVSLCCIGAAAKRAILRWCSAEGEGYEPTILVDPRSLR
ncbi:Hypothetical predicted protein [Lecanosticta acicola]|uniref:Uncharacterized protein n=1 Tax=Lecanosticta acicola TaxID=111012 RepID=A0AAI8YYU2_9PEZI|nr:Hypothetical predicted protein [Lecanosticta acicola]